jgi:mannose-6-phosphate isomerase-like protein (cupin superfamily)
MTSHTRQHYTRVVTVGNNADGRSTVISDAPGPTRYPSPVLTSTAVWEADRFPVVIGAYHTPDPARYLPPTAGFRVFTSVFRPESEWAAEDPTLMARLVESSGLTENIGTRPPGFHKTATVDVIVMVSGEIVCELDVGEVVLQPGDTLIQQGGAHTWRNRSDQDATLVCIMVDGTAT